MAAESDDNKFLETARYRCLFRTTKLSEDIFYISCGIERCWAGKRVDMQKRPGYHLHVILNGFGELVVDGKTHKVHIGQMFLLKPGEHVIYTADKGNPWTYCWVTFDGLKAQKLTELAGFTEGINVVNNNLDSREFLKIVQDIMNYPEMNVSSDLMRIGLATAYIAKAVESYNKERRGSKKYRDYSQESYVSYAVSLIEANYNMLHVEDIADTIGIHRSHLAAIFKKEMGVSPQEYLLRVRVGKACQLLRETRLPIKEIADMVGYENPLTFSKTFKKMMGTGPRNYRGLDGEEREIGRSGTEKGTEKRETED